VFHHSSAVAAGLLLGAVRARDIGRQSSAQHAETAPQHGAQQQVLPLKPRQHGALQILYGIVWQ